MNARVDEGPHREPGANPRPAGAPDGTSELQHIRIRQDDLTHSVAPRRPLLAACDVASGAKFVTAPSGFAAGRHNCSLDGRIEASALHWRPIPITAGTDSDPL